MGKIDVSKLENVFEKPDNITARCPACAVKGRDNKGDHLVVYPNGKFGCIMYRTGTPGRRAHNKEIFRLAGSIEKGDTKVLKQIPKFEIRPHRHLKDWN